MSTPGAERATPVVNRPGLPALAYRIGTHPSVLQRMLERLPEVEPGVGARSPGSGDGELPPPRERRPLATLTTRSSDDPVVALLDAWATTVDVLTFYQERIANEGFLRTATERRSIVELARAIGYELNPGVAASTYLAFIVDPAKGAPGRATIPEGLRVQSVPGQDERPQPFETAGAIEARVEWNVMRPQLTEPQRIEKGRQELVLAGAATTLQPGDAILVVGDERITSPPSNRWDLRILSEVTPDPAANVTRVAWAKPLGSVWPPASPARENIKVYTLRQRASLFGHNAPDWPVVSGGVKCTYVRAYEDKYDLSEKTDCDPNDPTTWNQSWDDDWPGFQIRPADSEVAQIDLDAVYPRFADSAGWIVLESPSYRELYKVTHVSTVTRADFTLSAKISRLELDTDENLDDKFGLRDTTVYGQAERLEVADVAITAPLSGDVLTLDRPVRGLLPGRTLVVSGKRKRVRVAATLRRSLTLRSADGTRSAAVSAGDVLELLAPPTLADAEPAGGAQVQRWQLRDRTGFEGTLDTPPDSDALDLAPAAEDDPLLAEVATVRLVREERDRTVLTLAQSLRHTYDLATVQIAGNVVAATHGETVREVLGSGDGSAANQRFTLKKSPLTYVAAPTPTGGESTLDVRVGGVLWAEVPSLYALPTDRQGYIVRIDDAARATVVFGDGVSGARLPTGSENVVAVYRSGIGPEGEVKANAITLMASRPFGVREVTNPIPATGAAPPERLEDARANAPLTVLTLDRIVSLRDVEDFARAFSGIGKAQAVALWQGERRVVVLTVAGDRGGAVGPDSATYKNLVAAIDAVRDPTQVVRVAGYELRTFRLEARVLVDPLHVAADVVARATRALRRAFAFERRAFGQPVTASEVTAVLQGVDGVLAADLNALELDAKPSDRALADPPAAEEDAARATAPEARGWVDWLRMPSLAGEEGAVRPKPILRAEPARLDGETFRPAELLLINPDGITLREVTT